MAKVILIMEKGIPQKLISDENTDLLILDKDIEGLDDDELVELAVEGSSTSMRLYADQVLQCKRTPATTFRILRGYDEQSTSNLSGIFTRRKHLYR